MVKKAFVFSLISILLVISFSIIFSILVTEYSELQDDASKYKAEAINRYYTYVVDYYLPFLLEHSSKNALKTMQRYSIESNRLIPPGKFYTIHSQLLEYGNFTYLGGLGYDYMGNNTLSFWAESLSYNSSKIHNLYATPSVFTGYGFKGNDTSGDGFGISKIGFSDISETMGIFSEGDFFDVDFDFDRIYLFHENPFEVTVQAFVKINFTSDEFELLGENIEIKSTYSIIDLIDPFYAYYSKGSLLLPIKNSTELINKWDYDKLKNAIPKDRFYNSPSAPSFLMRMQGNFSPSIYGIESFVHPLWYSTPNNYLWNYTHNLGGVWPEPINRVSHIDYLFFQGTSDCELATNSTGYLYNITGLSDDDSGLPSKSYLYFKLDFNNSVKYLGKNFSDYVYATCPKNP